MQGRPHGPEIRYLQHCYGDAGWCVFYSLRDDARCIAVLEARPEAELTGDLSTFQEKVSNVLDVSLSAFLSGEVCCDQLPIAYDGLCGALPYQKLFGPNSTITAEMLARRELQEYTLHEEHLRRISKEILRHGYSAGPGSCR